MASNETITVQMSLKGRKQSERIQEPNVVTEKHYACSFEPFKTHIKVG